MKKFVPLLIVVWGISAQSSPQLTSDEIHLGVVQFGTVNWELAAIKQQGLDEQHNIRLKIRSLATPQSGKIALQSGAVDMVVSDWIWVSRQRSQGMGYTFVPYSNTAGALVVAEDSGIETIQDLAGKRLGIAGGGIDKNWLLLQALAHKQYGLDLKTAVDKVFGAPPLLNNQMLQGNLDALINYWHYAVQLEAEGYKQLMDGHQILTALGVDQRVPSLGFVFNEEWAAANRDSVSKFLMLSRKAKDLLCSDSHLWQNIVALTKTLKPEAQRLLRGRYCDGRIQSWGEKEKKAAQTIFELLYRSGGEKLVGKSTKLEEGTFWDYQISEP